MACPMPARSTRYPITWRVTKKAATVVTPHAMSEMMRARRNASRCSITDMRCSSTGALWRGARCRTLFRRATRETSAAYEVVLLVSEDVVVEAAGGADGAG